MEDTLTKEEVMDIADCNDALALIALEDIIEKFGEAPDCMAAGRMQEAILYSTEDLICKHGWIPASMALATYFWQAS